MIETDEPGLRGFVEHGEGTSNPQPSSNRFLPSSLLINEQDIGIHFNCERDRLAFSRVKLPEGRAGFRAKNFQPLRLAACPISN